MKIRLFVLFLLLSAVAAVTFWRVQNPRQRTAVTFNPDDMRPAPEFQLLDQNSRPVRLKGYLGRHRILLCFFDPAGGPNADPVLQRLKEVYPVLKRSGVVALAVSSPLGPEQKAQTLSYPFPILRDTLAGQPDSCSYLWGRAATVASTERSSGSSPFRIAPAMFLIEANGLVRWEGNFPAPEKDAVLLINALVSGQI